MNDLDQECRRFARFLVGADPAPYVAAKYRQYLEAAPIDPADRFDRILLEVAGRYGFLTGVADLHARLFRPAAALRRRLVLLLAILEASPPTASELHGSGGGRWAAVAVLLGAAGRSTLQLLLGAMIFLPLRFWAGLAGDRAP